MQVGGLYGPAARQRGSRDNAQEQEREKEQGQDEENEESRTREMDKEGAFVKMQSERDSKI